MSQRQSFTQAVYDYLTARPWIYVEATRLEEIGGRQAWRTRVSDARRQLRREGRGDIANRQRRMKDSEGRTWTLSEYRFEPAADVVTVSVDAEGQATFL